MKKYLTKKNILYLFIIFLVGGFAGWLYELVFYYFTEGTIRFFIVPYIYSFLGITFSFLFNKKRDLILEPLILYYGISFIAQFLIGINIHFVYIDPIIIMANQALEGYSSILLIISTIAIYIICIIIVFAKNKKIEIGVI